MFKREEEEKVYFIRIWWKLAKILAFKVKRWNSTVWPPARFDPVSLYPIQKIEALRPHKNFCGLFKFSNLTQLFRFVLMHWFLRFFAGNISCKILHTYHIMPYAYAHIKIYHNMADYICFTLLAWNVSCKKSQKSMHKNMSK